MAKKGVSQRHAPDMAAAVMPQLHGRAAAMRDEAQRLRDYAEAAADWFWEMDEDCVSLRCRKAARLRRTIAAEFIGQRIADVAVSTSRAAIGGRSSMFWRRGCRSATCGCSAAARCICR